MNGKRYYTLIATAFLFLMIGIKGLGYHSFTHGQDEDTLQCELCVFVAQQEAEEFSTPTKVEFSPAVYIMVRSSETLTTDTIDEGRLTPDALFSRPPPVLV